MRVIEVRSRRRSEMIDVTREIEAVLSEEGAKDGFCTLFVPHTTAAVTINEHADPDVARDILYALDKWIPWDDPGYRHGEGNSAAHVKASLFGSSVRIAVSGGRLVLGTWQGVFFCEFDGPRTRRIHLHLESG